MEERHQNEQYFFDRPTVEHLAGFAAEWPAPACLCAPMIGRELAGRGVPVTVLDIDERFADVPGFCRFDVYRPHWVGREFGLIVCDPPFFNVSLSQLFAAVRMLSGNRFDQPLLISYLSRRSDALLGTFAKFGLKPTGYHPSYATVQNCAKNDIEFFGNLDDARTRRLAAAHSGR